MALSDLTRNKYTAIILAAAAGAGVALKYAPDFFQGLFVGILVGFLLAVAVYLFGSKPLPVKRPANRDLSAPVSIRKPQS